MMTSEHSRGFTLIELLVVISIIGALSSIILASLSTARNKAKDVKIKSEMNQLAVIATENYNDFGTYTQVQRGWANTDVTCPTFFTGTYAAEGAAICQDIFNNSARIWGDGYGLYGGTADVSSTYSFMSSLSNGKWYCVGSSGRKGEYASYDLQPGCYNNP